ncbi:hypothetical protein [Paenibacillus rhizophilus]|uniref:DUF975 family protein n=1 Tax=Paenibacillus rhizophilus TaxID=1850366 RepID=A0A3N9NW61_9BACL|nr:hypothetical protein [Paenibacillus rhizophilus]RQW08203.1 hypothetical protein EH198_23105 [Paenibacillus rhizophilus]
MRKWIIRGWGSVKEQLYILILLFIYRLLWGYFLYRFVRSAVVPALLRYPSENAGGSAAGRLLYYIDAQLSLSSEPDVRRWLWILLILAGVRLLATPFIRAGLLHELHQESRGERGLFFFPGMKKYGLPVLLFSAAEWMLSLLPLYWLLPKGHRLILSSYWEPALFLKLLPFILGWLLYVFIIRLILLYMQFGYTGGTGIFPSLLDALRCFLPAAALRILFGLGGLLIFLVSAVTGFLSPGLPALFIRQLAPLPSTLFDMWGLSAQYHLWRSKTKDS